MNEPYYDPEFDNGLDEPPSEWLDIQIEYEKFLFTNNLEE